MGVQQSYSQDLSLLNVHEWQERSVDQQQEVVRFGNYTTYQNIHTQEQIDAYEIDFPNKLVYRRFIQTFRWRKSEENIVRGKYFNLYQQDSYCSQNFIGCAYVEHIRTRLSDITDIPFPENLYVALAMIEGYRKLSQRFGCFQIKESQVCVDQQGTIRVWVNQSLQKDYPQTSIQSQNIRQEDMVQQIIYLVSENTDKEEQPQQCLFDFVYDNEDQVSFFAAKNLIYEYAKKYEVQIPNYFESVLKIFQHNQDQEGQQGEQSSQNERYENQPAVPNNEYQFSAQPHQNINPYKPQSHHHAVSYPVSAPYSPVPFHPKPVKNSQPIYHQYPQPQNQIYRNPLGYLPTYQNSSAHVIHYQFPKVNQNVNRPMYIPAPSPVYRSSQHYTMKPTMENKQNTMINTNPQIKIQNNSFIKTPSQTIFKQIAVGTSIISPFNTFENEKNKLTQINKFQPQQSQSQKNSKHFHQRQQDSHHNIVSYSEQQKFVTSDRPMHIHQTSEVQQMSNFSTNPIIVINNQPMRMSNSSQMSNKLCYFTAQSQQQIDPEVAADLLKLYAIF